MPVLVDDVEGVSRDGPYLLFHDEDGLFWDAVGRVYAQWWGERGELIMHFVCSDVMLSVRVDWQLKIRGWEGKMAQMSSRKT